MFLSNAADERPCLSEEVEKWPGVWATRGDHESGWRYAVCIWDQAVDG